MARGVDLAGAASTGTEEILDGRIGGSEATAERPSLARSAAWSFATNVAGAALSFLNVLILSRALGPVGRGDFAFLVTVALVTSAVSLLGVEQANSNFGAREPHLRRNLATNAALFALLLGGSAAAAVAGLAEVFPAFGGNGSGPLRALVLASVPVIVLQTYLAVMVQADYAFWIWNMAWLLPPVLNVVVNGSLGLLGELTVGTAVATWVAGQVLATVLLVGFVGLRLVGFGAPDLALARRSLAFGAKSHPGRIMMVGNYRMDQWFVGALAGSRELGLYSVAVAWSEILFFLSTALGIVQRPDLVRASREDAARQAAQVFRAATLLTVPPAVALFLLAPFLTGWVFGESFAGGTDDLRVLTLGAFGVTGLKLLSNALVAQRRPWLSITGVATAFALTIALDVLLIPKHGGLGAAIASTSAYLAGGAVVLVVFARALGARPVDLLPRPGDLMLLLRAVRRLRRRAG